MDSRGSAGGKATLAKYGPEHFRELGRKGFDSFTKRYFSGDRQQVGDWLRTRAHEAQLDSFASRELARRIERGEDMVSIELPVLSEPGEVPF